jgi:hypothetical protein
MPQRTFKVKIHKGIYLILKHRILNILRYKKITFLFIILFSIQFSIIINNN